MKKVIIAALGLLCASAIVVQAQDAKPKHPKLNAEQKAVMDGLLAKYDTNKDGKLDKTERASMSQEDKDKLAKIMPPMKKKHTPPTDGSTNAPSAPADKN
jgi:hypothetical protein